MTQWRVSPSHPNYEVSEDGKVRTRFRSATRSAGRVLKGSLKFGYLRYDLWDGERQHCVGAHRLVCEAWHGPAPTNRHEPAHWDGDRLNNRFANLRWATPAENSADKIRHGRSGRGEANAHAKLSDADVAIIRASVRGRRGEQLELARRYGVSESCISEIVNYRSRLPEFHHEQVAGLRQAAHVGRGADEPSAIDAGEA